MMEKISWYKEFKKDRNKCLEMVYVFRKKKKIDDQNDAKNTELI